MKRIPANHKVNFPKYLLFVDTESIIAKEDVNTYSEHNLKLGVSIYVRLDRDGNIKQRDVFRFRTAIEFWEYVKDKSLKRQTLTIYGHNLKYDSINLNTMQILNALDYEIPYPILNHKFIMSAYRSDGNKKFYKLKLVDTANFLMMSLAEIGKRFGMEKGTINFGRHTLEQMYTYCEQDTAIVEKFVLSYIQFLIKNDLGSFKDTLASTSSSIYRHKFLKEIWSHQDKNILGFERASFFGGRTECFFKGNLPPAIYRVFDVKSMYPYIMKTMELPYKLLGKINYPSINLIQSYIKQNKYIIIRCIIKTKDSLNPYPVRHMNEDKDYPYTSTLLFPNGTFECYLHLPEIQYALEHNHIIEIKEMLLYEKAILFDEFINYFYDIKEHTPDKSERELSKITMNSVYGWFAKRHYETKPMNIPYTFEGDVRFFKMKIRPDGLGYALAKEDDSRRTYHAWFGELYRVTADPLTPVEMGNVALAGAITAYARMYLFEMLQECGERNRFYCDTDSIVCNEQGAKNLQSFVRNELGGLEEQMIISSGTIHCPKDYMFYTHYIHPLFIMLVPKEQRQWLWTLPIKRKARIKGIGKLSRKIDNNHYEILHFTSMIDYIRTGKHGTIKIDKQLKRIYNKGIVDTDGYIKCPTVHYKKGQNLRVL